MKPSHEFRQHAVTHLIQWRVQCQRYRQLKYYDNYHKLGAFMRDASQARLTHAVQPLLDTMDKMQALLSSLKYVAILMVLWGSHSDAREYRHVHHSDGVSHSVRVYDPPRVVDREGNSVFDSGFLPIEWKYFDTSFMLDVYNKPIPFPIPPAPPRIEAPPEPDRSKDYAMMLFAAAAALMLGAVASRVTGRETMPTWMQTLQQQRKQQCTLVETRRWLPLSVSTAYLHLKHKLGLR